MRKSKFTEEQREFQAKFEAAGGFYVLVRSIEEVEVGLAAASRRSEASAA